MSPQESRSDGLTVRKAFRTISIRCSAGAESDARKRLFAGGSCLLASEAGALCDNYKLADDLKYVHGVEYLDIAYQHFHEGRYIDVHCWVFTPWSFLDLMGKIISSFGLEFELARFLTTQDHDLEFYVQLVKKKGPSTGWAEASSKAFETAIWPNSAMPTVPADGLYRSVAAAHR